MACHQVKIMAIRTVKVAPWKEEDAAYFPGIIYQRIFL